MSDVTSIDSAGFLALLTRLYADYFDPMRVRADSGYEVAEGMAAAFERVSTALARFESGYFSLFASGGAYSSGTVLLRRDTFAAGAVTVRAGTIVATPAGLRYVVLSDVGFGSTDVEVEASVRAVAKGWEWDAPGERTSAGGELTAGEVGDITTLRTSPAFGDPTIYVYQQDEITGGAAPMLEYVGSERGFTRAPAEGDAAFRLRIQALPDVVSPDAIIRVLNALLLPIGLGYEFIETFDVAYQTCYDAPSTNAGTPTYQVIPPTNPAFDTNLFCYDDPRDESPFRGRWLDRREMRAAFYVVVDLDVSIRDIGMAYADPGMLATDFHPALGPTTINPWRQTPAYDVPLSGTVDAYPPAYDGYDSGFNAATAAIYAAIQQARAAGVTAILEGVHNG